MQWPAPSSVPFAVFNYSQAFCNRSTCSINSTEEDKRDAITVLRILVSLLSIFGSLSIIVSVLWRRILCSPRIHPIFVISVADCVLGFSWVLGGAFWFGKIDHRSWCYLPSLLTVIMQCVTVNLTVMYALVAYSVLRRQGISDVLAGASQTTSAWSLWKIVLGYLMAWLAPALPVLIIFGIVASRYSLVRKATECSCWCLPYFINIVPLAFPNYRKMSEYNYHTRMVVLASSVILLVVYFCGFAALVFMYWKILSHIRRLRESAKPCSPTSYGSVGDLLMRGHSQAKKRVLYFLSAFIVTGIANVVLCAIFVVFETIEIQKGEKVVEKQLGTPRDHMDWSKVLVYTIQSLTAPLQGFLNALVYGWTSDNFVSSGGTPRERRGRQRLAASLSSDGDMDSSGLVNSGNHDHRDTSPFSGPSAGGEERTRLSDSGRNRQRWSRERSRDADSAVM